MITYCIDRGEHLVTCHVTVELRVLDAGVFIEQLFADPAFDSTHNILVFVEEATIAPDIIARNALAQLLLTWRTLHAPAKWGLVLPGSAWRRIAGQLIGAYNLEAHNVRCFPDPLTALQWLQEPVCAPAGS